jgi:hypothetical protein
MIKPERILSVARPSAESHAIKEFHAGEALLRIVEALEYDLVGELCSHDQDVSYDQP